MTALSKLQNIFPSRKEGRELSSITLALCWTAFPLLAQWGITSYMNTSFFGISWEGLKILIVSILTMRLILPRLAVHLDRKLVQLERSQNPKYEKILNTLEENYDHLHEICTKNYILSNHSIAKSGYKIEINLIEKMRDPDEIEPKNFQKEDDQKTLKTHKNLLLKYSDISIDLYLPQKKEKILRLVIGKIPLEKKLFVEKCTFFEVFDQKEKSVLENGLLSIVNDCLEKMINEENTSKEYTYSDLLLLGQLEKEETSDSIGSNSIKFLIFLINEYQNSCKEFRSINFPVSKEYKTLIKNCEKLIQEFHALEKRMIFKDSPNNFSEEEKQKLKKLIETLKKHKVFAKTLTAEDDIDQYFEATSHFLENTLQFIREMKTKLTNFEMISPISSLTKDSTLLLEMNTTEEKYQKY